MVISPIFVGVPNSREVVGLPLSSGGKTKGGVLYRSSSLQNITEQGMQQLVDSPVGVIADLRTPTERKMAADKLPLPRHVETVDASIEVGNMNPSVLGKFSGGKTPHISNHLEQDAVATLEHLLPTVGEMYIGMLKEAAKQFALVAGLVAQVEAQATNAVLIHCTAGKDRTGISTALILDTVGVDRDAIIENYAISQDFLAGPWADAMLGQLQSAGIPLGQKLVNMVTTTPPEAMEEALKWVDKHHGSSANYLQTGGMTTSQIDALVEVLT